VPQPRCQQFCRLNCRLLSNLLRPDSVLDVGCGRGGWLAAWESAGCAQVCGVDGDYVDRTQLHIAPQLFQKADLSVQFDLGRRFDLVQCLEVAEHIPPQSATVLVDSITRHGDTVLFSAAEPGQGGLQHINERPLDYWRGLFAARGYEAFDAVRPRIYMKKQVEPWYRFNSIIYANGAGQSLLPTEIVETRVPAGVALADFGSFAWKLRKAILRYLPVGVIDRAAVLNSRLRQSLRASR